MSKKLTVIPEKCSGCKTCEMVCAIKHFGVTNPKKSAVRVLITYPHPVVRMPIVCSQCKKAPCEDACPVGALSRNDGVVHLDEDVCISCYRCIEACPFGAVYAHDDCAFPIKCDMCDGSPECVKHCPKSALLLLPEYSLGSANRLNNVLSYTQMKEIAYSDAGEEKTIRYAEIGKEEL